MVPKIGGNVSSQSQMKPVVDEVLEKRKPVAAQVEPDIEDRSKGGGNGPVVTFEAVCAEVAGNLAAAGASAAEIAQAKMWDSMDPSQAFNQVSSWVPMDYVSKVLVNMKDTKKAATILGMFTLFQQKQIVAAMESEAAGGILVAMEPGGAGKILAAMGPGSAGGILMAMGVNAEKAILSAMVREDPGSVGKILWAISYSSPIFEAVKILNHMDPGDAGRVLVAIEKTFAELFLGNMAHGSPPKYADADPAAAGKILATMKPADAGKILVNTFEKQAILATIPDGKRQAILANMV